MVPATNQDKTRIIGGDDLKQIKEEADSLYLKADQAVHARAEEMNRYDEDCLLYTSTRDLIPEI